MQTLAAHDIPHTLLDFPRFALDADYSWTKLRFLAPGTGRSEFGEAFRAVARPELIHRYGGRSEGRDGEAAERFVRAERRKRARRRAKRVAAALAIIAGAILAARYIYARSGSAAPGAPSAPLAAPDGPR
jgi:hypothetical protein